MEWLDNVHIYFVDSGARTVPTGWIYHYQTLISGFLAVAAAAVTVLFIREQIKTSQAQHVELIGRRFRSMRANLPLALMELSDYAQECIQIFSELMAKKEEDEDIKSEVEVPSLPISTLHTITELISLAEEKDAAMLQALLRFVQIQQSRLRSTAFELSEKKNPGGIILLQNLRGDVLDAFTIKKMTNFLFPYARWESDHIGSFEDSDFGGALEYVLSTSFDSQTSEYVTKNLVSHTTYYFSDRNKLSR